MSVFMYATARTSDRRSCSRFDKIGRFPLHMSLDTGVCSSQQGAGPLDNDWNGPRASRARPPLNEIDDQGLPAFGNGTKLEILCDFDYHHLSQET